MKKIHFTFIFVLIGFIGFCQVTHVQIDTNNYIYVPVNWGEYYGTQTSDAGLNTIFQNNQITQCYQGSHPVNQSNSIFAVCQNNNLSNFISELNNYTSLVTKVSICPQPETFGDVMSITLLNETIGIPTGFDSNGIVTTNDGGLNTIFQNFNVKYYSRAFPSYIGTESPVRVYYTKCNCDISLLKNQLDLYNSIIERNSYIGVAFLSTNEFEISKTNIYPNPFSTQLNIDSKDSITNYSVFDVMGKELSNCHSKVEFDHQTSQLLNGIYFLQLQFENGKTSTYKIIKE
ncbi:T9SS type A sorting domain-containing protein [Flavobacterium amnicola]|uniref:T9SS type A sorting domain-containing protein n=1 Tax=Flavobacterium amnicola TaxID=2506422 RepID=A0A4Q1K0N8_9FLAO|nr:T9SS type A sorting domain-containing protein [Flavobacterium amnicola]RXR17707.1 T9SS type A sorting domain-containing protein [Flavobacterium amnicola]